MKFSVPRGIFMGSGKSVEKVCKQSIKWANQKMLSSDTLTLGYMLRFIGSTGIWSNEGCELYARVQL
jgi:hypothetical protein